MLGRNRTGLQDKRRLRDPLGVRRCFGDVLQGLRRERASAGVLRRGLGPPTAPLAAPRAAEASEDPATPASSSRLRRRATTATSPRAGTAPGAGQARLAVADSDLDGVGAGA